MKTKTQAQTKADTGAAIVGDMPASLRREPATTATATVPVVEVTSDATPAKDEPAPKAKRARKAAAPKAKAEPKAKAARKPHQPSTIAPTEQNPAKSIVPVTFKKAYAAHNDTCGRPLNLTLKEYTTTKNADGRDALDIEKLRQVAADNGIDYTIYEHLNNGQKRMNVGNKLAGLVKQGKTVIIGKRKFADKDKALRAPQAAEAASAAA